MHSEFHTNPARNQHMHVTNTSSLHKEKNRQLEEAFRQRKSRETQLPIGHLYAELKAAASSKKIWPVRIVTHHNPLYCEDLASDMHQE